MRQKNDDSAVDNLAEFISAKSKEMAYWLIKGDDVEIRTGANDTAKISRVKKTIISRKD